MATIQNTYTGNGSTVLYSFTFPYLETADIRVSLNGTVTTAYTLANATTIQFNTAPANGAVIKIFRVTPSDLTKAEFYPGSAIRSADLNRNFLQTLYVTQETVATVDNSTSASLLVQITAANDNANTAVTTANSASTTANAIAGTANNALANSTAAVTTANAASTTANSISSAANTALATAVAALPKAGGTMTGAITLAADPVSNLQPSTKQYVDTAVTPLLSRSGGTMTGDLILVGAPTSNNMAATRAYVDSKEAFAAGTALLFAQTAAPTGWTKSTTHDNKALRVVSGTAGSGGSTAFTSVFTNRGVPLPEHSHGVSDPGHSHGVYDPGHAHGYQVFQANNGGGFPTANGLTTSGNVGAGTDGSGTGIGIYGSGTNISIYNSGTAGASMDFNVAYVDVIIATKN